MSDTFEGAASAADPGQGGTETVELFRQANLTFALAKLRSRPIKLGNILIDVKAFAGKSTGGSAGVDDAYAHTGTDAHGTLKGSAQAPWGIADLVLYPRTCRYQLLMSFGDTGTFDGSPTNVPDTSYSGGAYTPQRTIPASLHLTGSAQIVAYSEGCAEGGFGNPFNRPDELGCYEFKGGWSNDYALLEQCHAPFVVASCASAPQDGPEGHATITWSLTPGATAKKK